MGITGDGPCVVQGCFDKSKPGSGCTIYSDGSCSCKRNAGLAGACMACSQRRYASPRGTGADITVPASTFPIWPIAVVGVVAVGIFVATLAIDKRRR